MSWEWWIGGAAALVAGLLAFVLGRPRPGRPEEAARAEAVADERERVLDERAAVVEAEGAAAVAAADGMRDEVELVDGSDAAAVAALMNGGRRPTSPKEL